ncbi:uncharacterized protein LOC126830449 [Patella vulgata]|uniref:uncharacterized protein LOC126830449 n=1 Tax=Patella vulgata TaxID=6465 RepID=UPI0024A9DDD1|nr:uncharacterized protein LOC126830449 [Patella vulgata]
MKQASAKKNSFNRGKVLNDNISYGFDKKFNKHVGEKGGFEEELGSNSHKLDEFRDRQRALNFRRGNHASNFNKADAKKALRESDFNKNAAQKALQNNDYQRAKDLIDRDEVKSLRDSRRGNLKNAVHSAENGGFNNNNAVAAKTASSKNRQFADAAAKKTASQAQKDLDEAKIDKENSKRVLSDRNQNQRKLKRFFHDKLEGGNNFERLNFNRKRIESDFEN